MNGCIRCKWYEQGGGDYGECYGTPEPYQICLKRHNMANLKQFPFSKQLECFELPQAIVSTEHAQAEKGAHP